MDYQIKTADLSGIQMMVDWAAEEGWNPGLEDAATFSVIDPKGFFIGYSKENPVACISTVKYSDQFAFLGLYIAKKEYRGHGFGYAIWQHAMDYAAQCNIGLDGVVAQQENYKKSGFQLAHKNIRYGLSQHALNQFMNSHLVSVQHFSLALIFEYDSAFFPCARNEFLSAWLNMRDSNALVYQESGQIKGYGVIRKCREGYKVGPLFADSVEIAKIIFQGLIVGKYPVYLDIPEVNSQAKKLVETFNMQPIFETARMYNKTIPKISLDRTFGITSFEVG